MDPTTLGDRLHVLCVSVVYRGLAIPVAWKILPGQRPEAWHPHWCALLDCARRGVGTGWEVLVLTDRGLESPRLFELIVAHGWHIDYWLKNPNLNGGGPHYIIDATSGAILQKRYEQ